MYIFVYCTLQMLIKAVLSNPVYHKTLSERLCIFNYIYNSWFESHQETVLYALRSFFLR